MKIITFLLILLVPFFSNAQNPNYWQQHVDYTMSIDINVENYQYDGIQKLVYTNNSPDTIDYVLMLFNRAVKWISVFKIYLIQMEEWYTI